MQRQFGHVFAEMYLNECLDWFYLALRYSYLSYCTCVSNSGIWFWFNWNCEMRYLGTCFQWSGWPPFAIVFLHFSFWGVSWFLISGVYVNVSLLRCISLSHCREVSGCVTAEMYVNVSLPRGMWMSKCWDVFDRWDVGKWLIAEMYVNVSLPRWMWVSHCRDKCECLIAEMNVSVLLPRWMWMSHCLDVCKCLTA